MLAHQIVQELAERWREINLTVKEGVEKLATLCADEVLVQVCPDATRFPNRESKSSGFLRLRRFTSPKHCPVEAFA